MYEYIYGLGAIVNCMFTLHPRREEKVHIENNEGIYGSINNRAPLPVINKDDGYITLVRKRSIAIL